MPAVDKSTGSSPIRTKKNRSRRSTRTAQKATPHVPDGEPPSIHRPSEPAAHATYASKRSHLTAAAEISQLIGTMLAVVGLVFVIWELQGLKRATETSALIGIYGASNEINRFLVQQPKFRDHFYADDANETIEARNARLTRQLEDLAATQVNEFRLLMSFAELEADQFEQVFSLREAMPPGQWNSWWAYFIDTYDSSPLLRAYYDNNEDWYELDDYLAIDDDEQRLTSLQRQ